jgi:crossover junction endodeoxyribonuclease RusA
MSMNDRGHWAPKAQKVAQVREWSALAASEAHIPPMQFCSVVMLWTVPDKKRRDEENPMPDFKAACDGLVDAGVVPDDTPQYMAKFMPVITYEKGVAAVRFEVTGIAA